MVPSQLNSRLGFINPGLTVVYQAVFAKIRVALTGPSFGDPLGSDGFAAPRVSTGLPKRMKFATGPKSAF